MPTIDHDPETGEVKNLPATRTEKERAYAVVEHPIPMFDTARFEHMQRVANLIGYSSRLPEHWRGQDKAEAIANAFVLLNLSQNFEVDPLFLAQETFLTPGGTIGYTGKLIAANLERKFKIVLDHDIAGEGDAMKITTTGKRPSDGKVCTVEGTVGRWQTKNRDGNVKENWKKQPEDQLIYRATRQWARRYYPAAMLGMLSDDDMDDLRENMRTTTSRAISGAGGASALIERLQGNGAGQAADIVGHVARETGQDGGGKVIENDETQESAAGSPRAADGEAAPNLAGSGRAGDGVEGDGSSSPGADKPAPTESSGERQNEGEAAPAGEVAAEGGKPTSEPQSAGKQASGGKGRSKAAKPTEDGGKPKPEPAVEKPTDPEWLADLSEDQLRVYRRCMEWMGEIEAEQDGKKAFAIWKDFRKAFREKAKGVVEGMPLAAQDAINAKMAKLAETNGY